VALWPRLLVVVANTEAWAGLRPEVKSALREAGRASLPDAIAKLRDDDAQTYANLCRGGRVSFARATRADQDALRRAVAPVTRGLDSTAVATIARLRAAAGPPPSHPACRPAVAARGAPATPVDGVWSFDSDEDDLRAAHTPTDELTPENWGHWVFMFSRGRFAITQEDREACTWAYGTYRVRGQRMIWDVTDGGGHGPQNATNHPGEHLEFEWSRFRDTLHVSRARGAVSPNNFDVKPWRRIGDDVRKAPLSRRCPPPPRGLQF
jgi:hypothetical protein